MKRKALICMSVCLVLSFITPLYSLGASLPSQSKESYGSRWQGALASLMQRVKLYRTQEKIGEYSIAAISTLAAGTIGIVSTYLFTRKTNPTVTEPENQPTGTDTVENSTAPAVPSADTATIVVEKREPIIPEAKDDTEDKVALNAELEDALLKGNFETIEKVLQQGADPNIYIKKGLYSHAMIVIMSNIIRDRNVEQWLTILKLFKDKGMNLDLPKTHNPNYAHEDISTVRANLDSLLKSKSNYDDAYPDFRDRLQKVVEIMGEIPKVS